MTWELWNHTNRSDGRRRIFLRNRWHVNYKKANGKLIKNIKIYKDDLCNFRYNCKCEYGQVSLKISLGVVEKEIEILNAVNKIIDIRDYRDGIIKLELSIKAARNLKMNIGWRKP